MIDAAKIEVAAVAAIAEGLRGRAPRGRFAEGAALLKPLAKALSVPEADLAAALDAHAALEVRDVKATRLFGLFRRTRPAKGVALRAEAAVARRLEEGASPPQTGALLARCVAALCAQEAPEGARDFEGTLPGYRGAARQLGPLTLFGAERVEISSEAAGAESSRAKSQLARLRRFADGGGFEFSERARANSPMAALEALLQAPPALLAKALSAEEFERWLREDCKERELADLATATRLRAASEGLDPAAQKRLFVRLLSFSPLREAVAAGVVPAFVGRLQSAPEGEVVEIVATLEGLGTESVLEALVRAVYEVPPETRPRVLMAMGAVGSPRVLEPLVRLALHSNVKADRLEAAAAVVRIAKRFEGPASAAALKSVAASEDSEVRAMLALRESL